MNLVIYGVRDLYDVTLSSIGLGAWCIMGNGESYSAYCKEAFGWFNPQVITESATGLVLAPSLLILQHVTESILRT